MRSLCDCKPTLSLAFSAVFVSLIVITTKKKAPRLQGFFVAHRCSYLAEAAFLPPDGLILSVKFGHTSFVNNSILRINAACGMWL